MEIRNIPLAVGRRCWVKRNGVTEHGTVIKMPTPMRRTAIVRFLGGAKEDTEYAPGEIDSGFEFHGRGPHWVPEGDKRVLDWLEREISRVEALPWDDALEPSRREGIAWMRMILARNGRG